MENYWTLNRQGIDVDKFILQTDFSVITVGRASDQQLQCKSKILVCIYIDTMYLKNENKYKILIIFLITSYYTNKVFITSV